MFAIKNDFRAAFMTQVITLNGVKLWIWYLLFMTVKENFQDLRYTTLHSRYNLIKNFMPYGACLDWMSICLLLKPWTALEFSTGKIKIEALHVVNEHKHPRTSIGNEIFALMKKLLETSTREIQKSITHEIEFHSSWWNSRHRLFFRRMF